MLEWFQTQHKCVIQEAANITPRLPVYYLLDFDFLTL